MVFESSHRDRVVARTLVCAAVMLASAAGASAQSLPASFEVVASADAAVDSTVTRKPASWLDFFGAVRAAEGLDLVARPVVKRAAYDGEWELSMYELGVRYERGERRALRLNLGWQPSPIGYALLENRPDLNPVVSTSSAYYLPLPALEAGTPRVHLIDAAYPLAATATVSGEHWDVRGSLLDSSPVRGRTLSTEGSAPRLLNVAVGGGVTPRVGLRIGGAFARGPYAAAGETADPSGGERNATIVQGEIEWSAGHTRLAGEYVHTTFETANGDAVAQGGWVEGIRTLAPRWFVAARADRQQVKRVRAADGGRTRETYTRVEGVLGYRVTPSLTLRGGYLGRKGYVVFHWDDQLVASATWTFTGRSN